MMHTSPTQRPWPRPRAPWLMAMQWHDLAFLHWPVSAAVIQARLPPGLRLQTFDGSAWLGVVPFRMAGVRPHGLPAMPGLSAFPELNVRTYVIAGDKPGVWFFSLDAASPPAVEAARLLYHLPYFNAQMQCRHQGSTIAYQSVRTHRAAAPAQLRARYRPLGPPAAATPGSFEYWLVERYCLYAANRRGTLWRGEIDHVPWPLQAAEVEIADNSMLAPLGVQPAGPPLAHFAQRLDVVAWNLERI